MSEQFDSELSPDYESLSSPSPGRLRAWQLCFESMLRLRNVLDAELERDVGFQLRWYEVLIHLEETPEGMRMNELAERLLASKSGLTKLVDRMEEAGLIRRAHPENDRRSFLVMLTDEGWETLGRARRHHRHSIETHFASHLTEADTRALVRAFEKVNAHSRSLG